MPCGQVWISYATFEANDAQDAELARGVFRRAYDHFKLTKARRLCLRSCMTVSVSVCVSVCLCLCECVCVSVCILLHSFVSWCVSHATVLLCSWECGAGVPVFRMVESGDGGARVDRRDVAPV